MLLNKWTSSVLQCRLGDDKLCAKHCLRFDCSSRLRLLWVSFCCCMDRTRRHGESVAELIRGWPVAPSSVATTGQTPVTATAVRRRIFRLPVIPRLAGVVCWMPAVCNTIGRRLVVLGVVSLPPSRWVAVVLLLALAMDFLSARQSSVSVSFARKSS